MAAKDGTNGGERRRARREAERRAERMARMYAAGATLEEIGREYGITRERVRQVLNKVADMSVLKAEARTSRRQQRERQAQRALPKARKLLSAGVALQEVASELGIPFALVRELDAENPSYALRRRLRRIGVHVVYTDQELIGLLQRAARVHGEPLTGKAYLAYAQGRTLPGGRSWPTLQTFYKRFGSWGDALAAAGIARNPPSPAVKNRRFSARDCLEALRELQAELGRPPSAAEYADFYRRNRGRVPSYGTIINRFGSLSQALLTLETRRRVSSRR